MRGRIIVGLLGTGVAIAAAGPASADQRIGAGPPQRYTTPDVTIAQGERLTFSNSDIAAHDVTAVQTGPDNAPLFSTPLIGQGQEAFVEGSQFLTTGTYAFVCSIHANMTGTLRVSAEGTPVPRPGSGATAPDTTAPRLRVALRTGTLRKARADRAITLVVTLDEAAAVRASATAGGVRLGSARTAAGSGATTLRIRLDAADRRRIARSRAITVRVTATDAAGNRAARTARRTLR